MEPIVLKNKDFEATFLPDVGMNLISFKKGNVEIIDQTTKAQFEERYAGLGALIGPHFHRKKYPVKVKDESLFPHIARLKTPDPFSHGIGRYAPWKAEVKDQTITAVLTGKDTWNGVPLAELEGQNFKMNYKIELIETGLKLHLDVVSDTDSLVGIHFYYRLPNNKGTVISQVQSDFVQDGILKPIPKEWGYDNHTLRFDLSHEADYTFLPHPHPREGKILLETTEYKLQTTYTCVCEENCWQLYHPAGASFVAIEPVSAHDPRHPNLTVSGLDIKLEIL